VTELNLNRKVLIWLAGGLLLGIGLAAFIFLGSGGLAGAGSQPAPVTGSLAPDFRLANLTGGQLALSQLRGRMVIINFWATWCPPCKEEMPLLQAFANQHSADTVLLGVNDDEEAPAVQSFAEDNHLTFPILLDPGGKISDLYRVRAYPSTYFIDMTGKVSAYHIGILSNELISMYYKAAGGKP
jgi:cytochrome c biogenesis protein CcmG, thiol:disulfide interchange protein DsbE